MENELDPPSSATNSTEAAVEAVDGDDSLFDVLQQRVKELEAERVEVIRELDRAEAPPGLQLNQRVRELARAWRGKHDALTVKLAGDVARARAEGVVRRRLPDERRSITKKFKLPYAKDGEVRIVKGYATVGLYEDGTPGEIFIVLDQTGTSARGYADAFATVASIALQYGVPIEVIARKMIGTKFGPAGATGDAEIPMASSVLDYVFRWLLMKFAKEGE